MYLFSSQATSKFSKLKDLITQTPNLKPLQKLNLFSSDMKLLLSLVMSSMALAGSHNYINIYNNYQCSGEAFGELGIYYNDVCVGVTGTTQAQSLDTVLIETDCYILGYQEANCQGLGVRVSSVDPNTCVSASPMNGEAAYFQSFMLQNCV